MLSFLLHWERLTIWEKDKEERKAESTYNSRIQSKFTVSLRFLMCKDFWAVAHHLYKHKYNSEGPAD